jgi:uncharacterized protein (TIGR03000 family)
MAPIAGGGCLGAGYTPYVPAAPVIMEPTAPAAPAPAPMADESKSSANITIELPANATLYVDGRPISGTGATRRFHTPELPIGQAFYYDMKAEVEVDGQTVTEEIQVIVRGGENLSRSFGQLIALTGGSDRNVAVK